MLLFPSSAPPVFPASSVALPPAPGTDVKPYVFSITPLDDRRLLLAHGSAHLTVVDQATFQIVDNWSCAEPEAEVTSVVVNAAAGSAGEVWTAGKDGVVRTWDSRVKGGRVEGSKSASMRGALAIGRCAVELRADACVWSAAAVPGGKTTPLLSLANAPEHHLLAAGTELTNHEASIVYWCVWDFSPYCALMPETDANLSLSARDPRAPKTPLYQHTTIHSDDITTLAFAPPSLHGLSFPLEPASPSDEPRPPPKTSAILLSGSTDGTLSLTDAREADEDEAQLGVANVNVSVADAGWTGSGWGVWGRDDMDGVSVWDASDVRPPSLLPEWWALLTPYHRSPVLAQGPGAVTPACDGGGHGRGSSLGDRLPHYAPAGARARVRVDRPAPLARRQQRVRPLPGSQSSSFQRPSF